MEDKEISRLKVTIREVHQFLLYIEKNWEYKNNGYIKDNIYICSKWRADIFEHHLNGTDWSRYIDTSYYDSNSMTIYSDSSNITAGANMVNIIYKSTVRYKIEKFLAK